MAAIHSQLRRTILIALMPLCMGVMGSAYHFSPAGNDSRSALQAGSAQTPWKSLSKLGEVVLKPGDSILLERGGVWRETLRLGASGTEAMPILISSYGSGARLPEIRGSEIVRGGGGVERTTKLPAMAKGLFLEGRPVPMSRYPDTGWLVATSVEGDSALSSSALPGKDWVGASVHVRASMWGLGTLRVRSSQGGRISFTGAMGLPDSVRFYMGNHPAGMVAGSGRWWSSARDSSLHWTLPGAATDAPLEAAVREYGIRLPPGKTSGLVELFQDDFQRAKAREAGLEKVESGEGRQRDPCRVDPPGERGGGQDHDAGDTADGGFCWFAVDRIGHGGSPVVRCGNRGDPRIF